MTDERIPDFWEEGRYSLDLLPPNERKVRLWGVRDRRNGDEWAVGDVDGEGTFAPRSWALAESAHAWINRVKHLTAGAPNVPGR